uniref:Uncharacterized protein n=1 Tax=Glossina pallidipes TaxID=7398 RepID=A0A1A9ZB76_GLOPL
MVTRLQEGTDTQIFKCKIIGWDEVMAVDFTRTSVAKTGADLTKWATQQETRADLAALFMPRQQSMPLSEAEQLEEDRNYNLKATEAFVLKAFWRMLCSYVATAFLWMMTKMPPLKFLKLCSREELEVVRIPTTQQQQENLKFSAHFKRKFIIHTGKRKDRSQTAGGKAGVEFFHSHSNDFVHTLDANSMGCVTLEFGFLKSHTVSPLQQ